MNKMDNSLIGKESKWSTDAQNSIAGQHMVILLMILRQGRLGLLIGTGERVDCWHRGPSGTACLLNISFRNAEQNIFMFTG